MTTKPVMFPTIGISLISLLLLDIFYLFEKLGFYLILDFGLPLWFFLLPIYIFNLLYIKNYLIKTVLGVYANSMILIFILSIIFSFYSPTLVFLWNLALIIFILLIWEHSIIYHIMTTILILAYGTIKWIIF